MNKKILIALFLVLMLILMIKPIYANFQYYGKANPVIQGNNSLELGKMDYYPEEFPSDEDGVLNQELLDSLLAGPNANGNGLMNEGSKLNSLFTYKNSKKLDFKLSSEDKILVDGEYITLRDYLEQPENMYFIFVRETGNWFNQTYYLYSTNNLSRYGTVKPVYKTTINWYYNAGNSYYEVKESQVGEARALKIYARSEADDFADGGKKVPFFDYESWKAL